MKDGLPSAVARPAGGGEAVLLSCYWIWRGAAARRNGEGAAGSPGWSAGADLAWGVSAVGGRARCCCDWTWFAAAAAMAGGGEDPANKGRCCRAARGKTRPEQGLLEVGCGSGWSAAAIKERGRLLLGLGRGD